MSDKEKTISEQSAVAVLSAVKEDAEEVEKIITHKGVRIKIVGVSPSLMDDVSSRIKDPEVPSVYIEDKGREEPNPSDPEYLRKLTEAEDARDRAMMDTLCLMGIELIDGLPEDEGWLEKILYLDKMGLLDLSDFDIEDEMDKSFLFKRYYLAEAKVIKLVSEASGATPKEVEKIEKSFQD